MFTTFSRTPRKPMKKVSEKRERENAIYAELKRAFLKRNPRCHFPRPDDPKQCDRKSFDVHHRNGRLGKNFLDVTTWSALCRTHHDWVETHKNEAREIGLITYR